jgi:hypothetical protein
VVTYQPDSPSRMCDIVRLMRRPASGIHPVSRWALIISTGHTYVYACLSSSLTHVCTHIDATSASCGALS